MLNDLKLRRLWVPVKNRLTRNFANLEIKNDYPQCDIFVSEDFTTNNKKLLCLIQGTGNVRAGYK